MNPKDTKRKFGSDNASPAHPEVLKMMCSDVVNEGHVWAYGNDWVSSELNRLLQGEFGENVLAFPVGTGTAGNVASLASVVRRHEAIICADSSHLHNDECGAPERFLGCKLLTAETHQGKVSVETIARLLEGTDMVHRVQPKVVSIAQCTEWGTVYTPGEIQAIADFCHENGLLLHVDGARLYNAAVALGTSLAGITSEVGVDILSLGGTKNGAIDAEAVVFFADDLAEMAGFSRKQAMHLFSKMRYKSAQFIALLSNRLWHINAAHANTMARVLEERLSGIEEIELVVPRQTNVLFARMPANWIPELQAVRPFAVWDPAQNIVRLMTSWDTQVEEIDELANRAHELVDL